MQVAVGLGDVDALMNRGDVRRAGKWPDDAARAKNRQATENAQARIHGFQRQGFTVLDVDRHRKPAGVAELQGQGAEVVADHLARHRIDRRFADAQHQAWACHGADAEPGAETDAGLGGQAHLAVEQGTVGHVRVVTGILDGAGFGAVGQ